MEPIPSSPAVAIFDSVTHIHALDSAVPVVCGSHAGAYSARVAIRRGVQAIVLSDAGIGLDEAGVAGLEILNAAGIAAGAAAVGSARIGDARDIHARGILSRVNELARRAGVQPGMRVSDALELLLSRACSAKPADADAAADTEERQERDDWGPLRVVLLDSNSLARRSDDGAVVITGSHGALLGGDERTAITCTPLAAFYNDAGAGADNAGVSRLPALDKLGIAAAAVDARTARIGSATSTLDDGVISTVNHAAERAGLAPGMTVRAALSRLARSATR